MTAHGHDKPIRVHIKAADYRYGDDFEQAVGEALLKWIVNRGMPDITCSYNEMYVDGEIEFRE